LEGNAQQQKEPIIGNKRKPPVGKNMARKKMPWNNARSDERGKDPNEVYAERESRAPEYRISGEEMRDAGCGDASGGRG